MLRIAKNILSFALLLSTYAHAVIETNQVVDTIGAVPVLIKKLIEQGVAPDKILVASDWDLVICAQEGVDHDLLEGDISAEALDQITALGVRFAALTSRGRGVPPTLPLNKGGTAKDTYLELIANMHKLLDDNLSENPLKTRPFLNDPADIFKASFVVRSKKTFLPIIQSLGRKRHNNTSVALEGIIFAGSLSMANLYRKGEALAYILDQVQDRIIGEKPEHIIFIDDNPAYIENMREVFTGRAERMHLLHFPAREGG